MNIGLFIFILFALQMLCLYIGGKYAKGMKDNDDYFLASKSLKFFPLMMTFIATQVGGGLVLGSAEEAYKYGWSVLFYPLGAAIGLIVLSLGIGSRLASYKVSTIAQLFETVFGSVKLKKIASLLSIISLYMVFIGQLIASRKFMLSLGIDSDLIFIGFWMIVIVYTVLGGLKAVVATDIVQALFFMAAFGFCIFFALFVDGYSYKETFTSATDSFSIGSHKMIGWLFMPLLFMIIEQDMAQRCFAASNGRTVTLATLAAGIITLLIGSIPVFFGILGRVEGMEILPGASVLMTVIQNLSSPILSAVVGCAIIAAIISTADSLINAVSSNISQDFFKNRSVRFSQGITAFISILGIFLSFYFSNIVDILIGSYELSVSCLLIPVLSAIYRKRGSTLAATFAIAGGLIGFIGLRMYPLDWPRELISIGFSAIGFLIGEMIDCRYAVKNTRT